MNQPLEPIEIIQTVANYYHTPVNDVISDSRERELVKPRHLAMTLINTFTSLSLAKIASYFNREHCDVIHARKSVAGQCDIYPKYRDEFTELVSILKRISDAEFERYRNYDTDLA